MYYEKHQNAAGSKITVTATATNVYDLINTAASTNLPRAGFAVDTNAIDITVEDGDIRLLWDGNIPTSLLGAPLSSGNVYRFRGIPLDKMKLIRVTGDVVCSVQPGKSDRSESSNSTAYDVTLEASGVTIGNVDSNLIEIAGTAVNANGGAIDAGTQTVVLATDDPAVTSLAIMDDWDNTASDGASVSGDVAHDAVDAGEPVKIGGKASTSEPTAVANLDRVDAYFDENGRLHIVGKSYDTNSGADLSFETAALNGRTVSESLVDTTNVSAATHYYPSATGATMNTWKDLSLTGKFIDADGTLTLTLEVTNDEDTTSGDWNGAYFYDDELDAAVTSKTVTNGTELFSLSANNNNFRYYRWVVVASGATNTVILKSRKKAL